MDNAVGDRIVEYADVTQTTLQTRYIGKMSGEASEMSQTGYLNIWHPHGRGYKGMLHSDVDVDVMVGIEA